MERRLYESIKYLFTDTEKRELGEALARENQTIYDLREQKKTITSEFNARIESAEKRASDLTTKINTGYELREVECLVLMETPRPGMKRLIRIDTNEMIRDEAMTAAEMQQNFGFNGGTGEES
jgi:hypothetical protein